MRFVVAAALALALSLSTSPAQAQRALCGDGAGMIAHLEKEWGEDPAVIALDAAGHMVRILVSPDTGTWSMLVTGPGGPTCLIHHGSAWEPIPSTSREQAAPNDPGDPS